MRSSDFFTSLLYLITSIPKRLHLQAINFHERETFFRKIKMANCCHFSHCLCSRFSLLGRYMCAHIFLCKTASKTIFTITAIALQRRKKEAKEKCNNNYCNHKHRIRVSATRIGFYDYDDADKNHLYIFLWALSSSSSSSKLVFIMQLVVGRYYTGSVVMVMILFG